LSRILCIDYGTRRTGLAVTDPTRTIAQGLPTIEHRDETEQLAAIRRAIAQWEATELVVGLPLSQSGKPSARSQAVLAFAERLRAATGLPVVTFDERFSTSRADELLAEVYGGTSRKKARQSAVDKVAATIILEDYLASPR
jgi:putative holliday junction resolvase